ncbi:hypothetical protein [Lacticaseibacillus sp. 866-1]|uniref:hypothetical protein n=1 Tax=Lacticaseibacillus sp. 866-1 TaxID=2799576 RepID=UPI0019427151|nr:hypothetical protein [Lacticaseibacillus sp. 866-1]
MINEEVQRRIASYYMESTMSEDEYNELESVLIDKIWETDERVTDNELVRIGIKLINELLIRRENHRQV